MTITINDIPNGQKISKISFEIDFETGESETFVKIPVVKEAPKNNEPIIMPFVHNDKTEDAVLPNNLVVDRPPKVDDDMLNGSF